MPANPRGVPSAASVDQPIVTDIGHLLADSSDVQGNWSSGAPLAQDEAGDTSSKHLRVLASLLRFPLRVGPFPTEQLGRPNLGRKHHMDGKDLGHQ
jgi:hypothetical protein